MNKKWQIFEPDKYATSFEKYNNIKSGIPHFFSIIKAHLCYNVSDK